MRKIGIPVDGKNLHGHFGGASMFKFYFIEDNKVVDTEKLVPPPHHPGVIPRWIADQGVTDVILGGVGQKAVAILEHFNIKVTKGVGEYEADKVIEDYLAGTLEASEENCNHDHHQHHDHGHQHNQ